MAYDSDVLAIDLGSITLSSADTVRDFEVTSEGRWLLADVLYTVTTTTAGATTTPAFKAGSTADDDKILSLRQIGAVTAGNTVRSLRKQFPSSFNDTTPLENGDTLRFTAAAATGAGAAGVVSVTLLLRRCGA